MVIMKALSALISLPLLFVFITSCATGGGSVAGNENGSTPVNQEETIQYQKAIRKCQKTGGTRVVKIKGELRCY